MCRLERFSWEILGEELYSAGGGHPQQVVFGRLVARAHAGLGEPGGTSPRRSFPGYVNTATFTRTLKISVGVIEFLDADGRKYPFSLRLSIEARAWSGLSSLRRDLVAAELVELVAQRADD